MFILSFIFVIVLVYLSESESACFYRLLIYVFPLEIQLSRKGVGNPVTGLTPPYFISVPSQDLDLQRHMPLSLFYV